MFSTKVIAVLNRQKISLYVGNSVVEFEFSKNILQYLEVVDKDNFKSNLKEFLISTKVKNAVTYIVLDTDITFTKEFSKTPDSTSKLLVESFLTKVPIDPVEVNHKIYDLNNTWFLVVTNSDILLTVQKAFEEVNWKVLGVYPMEVLYRKGIDPQRITKNAILSQIKTIPSFGQAEKTQNKIKIVPLLIVPLIALIAIGAVSFLYLSNSRKAPPSQPATVNILPETDTPQTTQSSSTITEEPKYKPQQDLTILVQNGSNISGLAAKIQTKLTTLGYKTIEIKNAASVNKDKTVITFSNNVSPEDRKLIINAISDDFKEVDQNEDDSGPFDISIVTGILTR